MSPQFCATENTNLLTQEVSSQNHQHETTESLIKNVSGYCKENARHKSIKKYVYS